MRQVQYVFGVVTACLLGSCLMLGQNAKNPNPPMPMSFFITSAGPGDGGNLGGLAGADAQCQKLATAVGGGNKTWRAYLSTQAANGKPAINARDRIGQGPWFNSKGIRVADDVGELHGDTLDQARLGNNINLATALNEKGDRLGGVFDKPPTCTTLLPALSPTAARLPTTRTIPVPIGRVTLPAPLRLATMTALAEAPASTPAAIPRGIRRTPCRVAARQRSHPTAARLCSIALPSIDARDARTLIRERVTQVFKGGARASRAPHH